MKRPRHGGNLGWAVAIAGCPAFLLLDFSASINPLGPPVSVLDAIQGALPELVHYPDPDYYQLRRAIARYHQLDLDWVLPGNGSAELLTLAGKLCGELDCTNLVTPAFGDYGRSWRGSGGRLKSIAWSVECPWPWEKLSQLGNHQRGDRALLLNNPHNPSGQLLLRRKILELLPHYRWVVVDEAFMDFLPPEEQQSLITDLPHWPQLIILRSLTKFYSLPGLRFGYALGHPELLKQWQQWRDPWPVNVLAQAAAIASLENKEFQQQTWQWLPMARKELYQGLQQIPGLTPLPSAANFLLVKTAIPASQLQRQLLTESQILIRDCLSFEQLGDGFFRVAVRTGQENQRLLKGLTKICGG